MNKLPEEQNIEVDSEHVDGLEDETVALFRKALRAELSDAEKTETASIQELIRDISKQQVDKQVGIIVKLAARTPIFAGIGFLLIFLFNSVVPDLYGMYKDWENKEKPRVHIKLKEYLDQEIADFVNQDSNFQALESKIKNIESRIEYAKTKIEEAELEIVEEHTRNLNQYRIIIDKQRAAKEKLWDMFSEIQKELIESESEKERLSRGIQQRLDDLRGSSIVVSSTADLLQNFDTLEGRLKQYKSLVDEISAEPQATEERVAEAAASYISNNSDAILSKLFLKGLPQNSLVGISLNNAEYDIIKSKGIDHFETEIISLCNDLGLIFSGASEKMEYTGEIYRLSESAESSPNLTKGLIVYCVEQI